MLFFPRSADVNVDVRYGSVSLVDAYFQNDFHLAVEMIDRGTDVNFKYHTCPSWIHSRWPKKVGRRVSVLSIYAAVITTPAAMTPAALILKRSQRIWSKGIPPLGLNERYPNIAPPMVLAVANQRVPVNVLNAICDYFG